MSRREEIEAEHLAALASLTDEQRAALHRIREALHVGNFSHHSLKEVLLKIFDREARERSDHEGRCSSTPDASTAFDIEREHLAALASLTHGQRRALRRIETALQIGNFSHHSFREILRDIFDREAAEEPPVQTGPERS